MKLTTVFCITAALLSLTCKVDYDIQEVAPSEHLGTDHEHEAETVESGSVHEESNELDVSDISGSSRHVHDAGVRNHGTGWFFNQPWAASFIWGKMVRDIVILLALSAIILFVSGYRRKHQ